MKFFSKILVLALVAANIVACSKEPIQVPSIDTDVENPLDPNLRYIHFDAEVSTRGVLIDTTVLADDFAVLGYSYLGSWSGNSVMATPNVFDSIPETVEYNDGLYEYSELKNWTGNTYSFYGYYPIGNANNKITLFDNGVVKSGDPYITYELISRTSSLGLIDVMTASYKDTGVSSSSSVPMHFRHRLAAIDVGVRNYYEFEFNGEMVPVWIEIVGLQIAFENLVNQKAKIYLDHTIPSVYTAAVESNRNANYPMVGVGVGFPRESFLVKPNTASDRNMRYITTTKGEKASSIIVIPQTDYLKIGGNKLQYKKKYDSDGDGEPDAYIKNEDPSAEGYDTDSYYKELSLTFNNEIKEGRRYYIELTFTSNAVSINVVAADEWTEQPDVEFDFE